MATFLDLKDAYLHAPVGKSSQNFLHLAVEIEEWYIIFRAGLSLFGIFSKILAVGFRNYSILD